MTHLSFNASLMVRTKITQPNQAILCICSDKECDKVVVHDLRAIWIVLNPTRAEKIKCFARLACISDGNRAVLCAIVLSCAVRRCPARAIYGRGGSFQGHVRNVLIPSPTPGNAFCHSHG